MSESDVVRSTEYNKHVCAILVLFEISLFPFFKMFSTFANVCLIFVIVNVKLLGYTTTFAKSKPLPAKKTSSPKGNDRSSESNVPGQISFQKIQTHPSINACSCYMKVSKGSNQKQQRKSGNTIFPIIRSIGVFLRRSRAANSVVGGPIWPKFEFIHNIMHVLVTSKFEKDWININRDYVMTSIF